jgi:hypothetical protein
MPAKTKKKVNNNISKSIQQVVSGISRGRLEGLLENSSLLKEKDSHIQQQTSYN